MRFGGWGFGTGWSCGRSGGWTDAWSAGAFHPLSEEDVALLLLSLLREGPRQGYELALLLEERSDGGLDADVELVYPLLQLLVDRELVAVRADEEKKRYELTDAGRTRVEARAARVRRLWKRARRGAPLAPGDERMVEETVGGACASVAAAVREMTEALGDLFGCGPRGRARPRGGRHGCGCC